MRRGSEVMLKNLKIRNKLFLGFGLVVIILTVLSVVSYTNITAVEEANSWNEHTHNVLAELSGITMSMVNMETGQRGFSLTGKEASLEPYFAGKNAVNAHLDTAKSLTSDNPRQQELLTEVKQKVVEWMAIAETSIEMRRDVEKGVLTMDDVVVDEQAANGKVAMDGLRALITESEQMEAVLLVERSEEAAALVKTTNVVLIAGTLIAVFVSVVIAFFITQGIARPMNKIGTLMGELTKGNYDLTEKLDVKGKDEISMLTRSFNSLTENISKFIVQVEILTEDMEKGDLGARSELTEYSGFWKELLATVNNVVDTLEGHIRRIPVTMMAIDREFNIQYMNDAAIDATGVSGDRAKGSKCYDLLRTGECRTGNCAIGRAMREGQNVRSETIAKPKGIHMDIAYEGVPIKDRSGNVLGAIEMVVDQTAIKQNVRIREKQAQYQSNEVDRLLGTIKELGAGNFNVHTTISETDEDTEEIGMAFGQINDGLQGMTESVSTYINETAEILTQMSNKNMDQEITREYVGDFAAIKSAINHISDSFNSILEGIRDSAQEVTRGSEQVAQSAQQLSQGATEQASEIEEITASITQVAEQTKENASNASKANKLSEMAKEDAKVGNEQMIQMVSAMNEINESSNNISKIIKVIDEIAFQTNILALNAAVEAARAGQHGKGFAVVADEVRNLAARSADAAKETTAMIENSIEKVQSGTEIAQGTAKALEKIVSAVTETSDIVSGIAKASNEQATAVVQVNEGINQVSSVTQHNSATAEESAAASEEMTSQAQLLEQTVREFKLRELNMRGIDYMKREKPMRSPMKKEAGFDVKKKGNGDPINPLNRVNITLDDQEFEM